MADSDTTTEGKGATPPTPPAPPEPTGQQGDERKFNQAELDAVIADRIKREREKYADYSDLKAKAEQWDKTQEAQKTEAEKANDRIAALQRDNDTLRQTTNDKLIRAEARIQAAVMGFQNPDDAYFLAELAAVSINDDGDVVGMKEALESLAKAKPYLLGDKRGAVPPQTDGGAGNVPAGAALTPGEQQLAQLATESGYAIDLKRIQERKAQAAVVSQATK